MVRLHLRPRLNRSFLRGAATLCLIASGVVACLAAASGCRTSHTLETGYRYQPLGASEVQRRAFYADPYSREAQQAEMERLQSNRPMPDPTPRR